MPCTNGIPQHCPAAQSLQGPCKIAVTAVPFSGRSAQVRFTIHHVSCCTTQATSQPSHRMCQSVAPFERTSGQHLAELGALKVLGSWLTPRGTNPKHISTCDIAYAFGTRQEGMVHLSLEAKQQLSALRFIPLILGSRLPSVGVGGIGSLSRSSETTSMIQTLLSFILSGLASARIA